MLYALGCLDETPEDIIYELEKQYWIYGNITEMVSKNLRDCVYPNIVSYSSFFFYMESARSKANISGYISARAKHLSFFFSPFLARLFILFSKRGLHVRHLYPHASLSLAKWNQLNYYRHFSAFLTNYPPIQCSFLLRNSCAPRKSFPGAYNFF